MKKNGFWVVILSMLLAFGLVFIGCGDSEGGPTGGGGGEQTGGTAPSAPTGVTATAASSSSISVSWSAVSGATSYKVYFAIGSSATKNLTGTVSGTSYTHTGLTAGTTYYYYIKAVNSAGESGYSSYASAAPSSGGGGGTTTAPSAPTGVTATPLSSSSISVTWNAVSGATSYKVYFEIGSSTTKNLAGTVSGTSYTHTGLTAGTNYYYYIKAVNSAGESGYSSSASAAPSGGGGTTTVPSAPTGVSASALSSSSIQITWNAPSSGTPTYYNVYRSSSSSGTYSFRAIVSGSVKTYTDTGLSSSTTYYYRITAENNSGESAMSITFGYATTQSGGGGTTTKPGTPTGVTATALSSDSIRITWSAVSGATKYNIYYGSSSTSAFTSLDGTSTTTSFTSTGNPAGSTSYFKVSAVNSAGESAKSSTVSATTTSSGGGGGSSSYGSLTIVNSSSHAIRNFTIYQSGYNLIGGTGFYLLSGTINAGSSQTFTNVPAGSYVRIGSETYGGYKVSRDTTWTVTSGQTTTLTVQSTWVVAN